MHDAVHFLAHRNRLAKRGFGFRQLVSLREVKTEVVEIIGHLDRVVGMQFSVNGQRLATNG